MSESIQQIDQLLDHVFAYGPVWVYLAIFAACFVENLMPPFPGDSFIVAGGGLVAVGRLDLHLTLLTVLAGGVSSVMFLYLIGKNYGRAYFVRKNFRYFSADDIDRVEKQLNKHGALILISSRFVVGMRVALAIAAGIGRYQAGRMFIYSTISYLLFAGLLMYFAIKLVENLELIQHYFTTYNKVVWPLLIALVVIYIVRRALVIRRRSQR